MKLGVTVETTLFNGRLVDYVQLSVHLLIYVARTRMPSYAGAEIGADRIDWREYIRNIKTSLSDLLK